MTHEGFVNAGWEGVADAFQKNFGEGRETGAAVAVYVDGAPVVDLWGGVADARTGRRWERDTAACVFSTTKGITAICAHLLLQRGELDLDAPVARYWPEFADGGKQDLLVRWLLTHQAGLSVLDEDLTLDDVRAMTPVIRAIEAQKPHWEPGTAYAYHAVTFGPLVGELVRRVTGKRLSAFIADELVAPLGLNLVLGLPEDATIDLAHLEAMPSAVDMVALHGEWVQPLVDRFRRSISLGSALPADLVTGEPGDFNDRRVVAAELGGSNLVSDARSLARVYAATVSEVEGVRLLTDQAVAECVPMRTTGCPPFGIPAELAAATPDQGGFGLGFIAGDKLSPSSFGHPGAGGSIAFGDLDARVGFAYVPNRMARDEDERARSLIYAVRTALG
jgi:CubicO group peptidase (beta-lactamase class C family)